MSEELRMDSGQETIVLEPQDFERLAGGWSRVRRRHIRTAKWRERDRAARALRWRKKRAPDSVFELPPIAH